MRGLVLALMLLVTPAWAVQPDEILSDPVLEQRARTLSKGLRCLVCRNESIDESNASLARDLRILLRERLVAGRGVDLVVVGGRAFDAVARRRCKFALRAGAVTCESA